MTGLLAAIAAAGITLPHVLRLQAVHPVTGIVLWLSSLTLRAVTGVLAVIVLVFFLPRTGLFMALTHWCLDLGWPFGSEALHVEGHGVADLVLLLPGAALALSLLYTCYQTAHSAREARRLVEHEVLGHGPHDSLIVSGPDVLFAVAGLVRPRIVVSAGALTCLDDEELEAALAHERAHIVRRHRFVTLSAVMFSALGRAVPGATIAIRELGFHIERDADRWAVRQRNDRLALASVICKAATRGSISSPTLATLGSGGVRERLAQLLDEHPRKQARPTAAALNALATATVLCTLLLAAVIPTAALAGVGGDAHRGHHAEHCHH
jgi:bla regulator protein blaR1